MCIEPNGTCVVVIYDRNLRPLTVTQLPAGVLKDLMRYDCTVCRFGDDSLIHDPLQVPEATYRVHQLMLSLHRLSHGGALVVTDDAELALKTRPAFLPGQVSRQGVRILDKSVIEKTKKEVAHAAD